MGKPRMPGSRMGGSRMPGFGRHAVGVVAVVVAAILLDLGVFSDQSPTASSNAPDARAGVPAHGSASDSVAVSASSSSTNGVFWAVLAILLLATVGIFGFFAYNRRRLRGPAEPADLDEAGGSGGPGFGAGVDEAAGAGGPGVQESEAEVARLLIETDRAVKTGERKLSRATTEFGRDSVAQVGAALDTAKQDLAEAFRLRADLDADPAPAEVERYRVLREVIGKCIEANAALDAESASVGRLRDLKRRMPEGHGTSEEQRTPEE